MVADARAVQPHDALTDGEGEMDEQRQRCDGDAGCDERRYGTGKWKKIVDDEQLGPRLVQRDNLSLGNKWRALEEVKEHSEGSEPAAKKAKSDDPRSVISDHQCVPWPLPPVRVTAHWGGV
jgi:hypothetical protein